MNKKGMWKRLVALALALVTVLSTNGISVMASAVNLTEVFGLTAEEETTKAANVTDASAENADSESDDTDSVTETASYTATSDTAVTAVTLDSSGDEADEGSADTDGSDESAEVLYCASAPDGSDIDDAVLYVEELTVPQYASDSSDAETYQNFTYSTSDGEASITGYVGEETEIVIPDTITVTGDSGEETFTVTSIAAKAFYQNTALTKVTLSDNVVTIGNYAFYQCTALETVVLSENLTTIGQYAFSGCSALAAIDLTSKINTVGTEAFAYCTSLTSICIPKEMNEGAVTYTYTKNSASAYGIFRGCTGLETVTFEEGVTYVHSGLFAASGVQKVVLPDTVTSINIYAFTNCTALTEINSPASLTSLGNYAFYDTEITSFELPEGMTDIGAYAFFRCESLESIVIPESVTSIGKSAFAQCTALKTVDIQAQIMTINESTFASCSSLESVTIPDTVTTIGTSAFADCSSLDGVVLPEGITALGGYNVFYNCKSLTSIVLPDSLTSMGWQCFYHCTSLASVTISAGLTMLEDGTFSGCTSLTEIVIPAKVTAIGSAFYGCTSLERVEFEGTALTSVGSVFKNCTSLTEVILPSELTTIGDSMFYGCTALTEIDIPDTVTSIGDSAFYGCKGFAEFVFPESLASIGSVAFYGCTSLTKITLPDSVTDIGTSAFYNCTALAEVNLPEGLTSIGGSAFRYCSSIEEITIPESVTTLGGFAFYECASLKSITIPESITSLGDSVFSYCTALAEVSLPDTLTAIGDNAFSHCTALTEMAIPDTVTSIGGYAFDGCSGLTKITLPKNLESIGIRAFRACTALAEITLPDSLTSLGNSAFYECTSLTEVTVPGSVTSLGSSIFEGCTGLVKAVLCDGLTSVGNSMFKNCTALVSVEIPESVTAIEASGFCMCSSLSGITLPSKLESIGSYAFQECKSIEEITFPDTLTSLAYFSFAGSTAITEIVLPDSLTDIGTQVFYNCSGLEKVTLPSNLVSIPGSMFSKCISLTEITIPETVTEIGGSAFESCSSLTQIVIPDSVTSLGNYAFWYCTGLEEIKLSENLTSIGAYAFYQCSSLTQIDLPDVLTSIGASAFYQCSSLTQIDLPDALTSIGASVFYQCSSLAQIDLPDALTSIGASAFYKCTALAQIVIPDTVTSIGKNAFYGCSALTELVVPDSVESIGSGAFSGNRALVLSVYPGSYAYDYAVSNSLSYKLLSDCSLTVDFEDIANWSDYAGTLLVAASDDLDLKVSKRISTATSYVLTGLISGEEYTVAVTNACGDVISSQTVELVKGENAVAFTELAAIADVAAHVYDADGNEVTDDVTVTWTEDGTTYAVSSNLTAVPVGTALSCEVRLGRALGLQYETPDAAACTVTADGAQVNITLSKFQTVTLTGTIVDESGDAVSGAAVAATQALNGYTNSATALSGSDGTFTLTVCAVDTQLKISAGGYGTVETEVLAPTGNVDLGTIALEALSGPRISLQVTYQYAAKSDATATSTILYSFSDVAFTIENQTTGSEVTEYSISGKTLVLGSGTASAGDKLKITLSSRTDDFDPVSITVKVGSDETATATASLMQRGSIYVTWESVASDEETADDTSEDGTVIGFVYDASGKQVYKTTSSVLRFSTDELPAGTYTVILAGYSEDFVYPQTLSAWQSLGLASGTDYVAETVTVTDGVIAELSFEEITVFDAESFSYLDLQQSSFTSSRTSATTGTYVTLRAKAVLKEEYAEQASDFKWILEISENSSFLAGTLSVSGQSNVESVQEDNVLEISVDDPSALTRFCVLLTETGDANAAAYLEFTIDGTTYRQAVGTLAVTCTELDFTMAEKTNLTAVPVSGTGTKGSTVKLYDDETLVGQTEISQSGTWSMTFEIYRPYTYTTHEVYAEVTTAEGITYRTETKQLIYQYAEDPISVSRVTMVNYGHREFQTVFTFDGTQLWQTVSYDYNPSYSDFTFLIEFSGEDLSVLSNVQLTVACSNGESVTLDAEYDEAQGCYVATGKFYSSALPTGVSVGYDADQELILSDEEVADEIAVWEEIAEIIEELEELSFAYDEETFAAADFSDNEEAAAAQTAIISSMRDLQEAVDNYESASSSIMGDVTWTETGYSISNESFSVECSTGVGTASIDTSGYTQYATTTGDTVYVTGEGTASSPLQIVTSDSQMTMSLADGATAASLAETMSNLSDLLSTAFNPITGICNDFQGSIEAMNTLYEETAENLKNATTKADIAKYEKQLAALKDYKSLGKGLKATSKALGKVATVVGVALDTMEAIGRWNDIGELVDGAGCSARMNANALRAEAAGMGIGKISLGLASAAVAGMIITGILTGGLSLVACAGVLTVVAATTGLGLWAGDLMDKKYDEDKKKLEDEVANGSGGCDCGQSGCQCGCDCLVCPGGNENSPEGTATPGFCSYSDNSSKGILDPSGYVYEAVLSNRLEGVTTTIYQKETLYDIYDEPYEQITLWDAAEYGQENPLTTNSEGEYAWDVPEGLWSVVYEKEGYVTEQSDWMEVPPPQTDINVGLVSYEAPVLEKVLAYTDGVEITFSKYMQTETLTAENITVKVNGSAVEGILVMTNEEENPEDTSETFTSVVTFVPTNAIATGATVTVEVSDAAVSYAGTAFAGEAVTVETVLRPDSFTADESASVVSGETMEVTIQALPAEAVAGVTVTVANQTSLLFTVEETEVTLDAEGRATVHVTGSIAGESVILFTLGDTGLTAETVVSVSMATPSITRSEVAAGNIDASLITALAGSRDAEQISFTGSYDLSGGLTLTAKSGVTGDKALLLQEDDSAASGLVLIDFCMIDSYGSITFSVEDAVDSVIVYGTNGDVTGDGVVNASDTLAILRGVSGRTALDAVEEGFADVNLDGTVNSNDLLAVVKYVSGRTGSLN